jgi:hypothetical protein
VVALAIAFSLGSESHGTFETPPTWKAKAPFLYPPGARWSSYTPRHWDPFSLPPTTRRATVELFESASTWDTEHQFNSTLILLPLCMVRIENIFPQKNLYYCLQIRCRGLFLPSRCLALDFSYSSTVPAFGRHVIIAFNSWSLDKVMNVRVPQMAGRLCASERLPIVKGNTL